MGCEETSSVYPTHMDGVEGWACLRWGGCRGDKEVVHCSAYYGHDYPFTSSFQIMEGLKILWDFMKAHPMEI